MLRTNAPHWQLTLSALTSLPPCASLAATLCTAPHAHSPRPPPWPCRYDYRQRLPSKEVSGTWSIMRVRPHTESARINEAAAQHKPRDTLGGGRWTIDRKYGNPPTFTPLPSGDAFRQSAPRKWVAGLQTPPATASGNMSKWRGGFATDFPRKVVPGTETMASDKPWLMPSDEFKDQFHDTVAVHTASLPAQSRTRFRPTREKSKELTGGDGGTQYWPQTPVGNRGSHNTHSPSYVHASSSMHPSSYVHASSSMHPSSYVHAVDALTDILPCPDPSATCTWNLTPIPNPSRTLS